MPGLSRVCSSCGATIPLPQPEPVDPDQVTVRRGGDTLCPFCGAKIAGDSEIDSSAETVPERTVPHTPLSDKGIPPSPVLPAIPGYEVLRELGRGGMGVVFQARQVKADRVVALKMLLAGGHAREELRGRFQVEAEAVARLQHPNIVQVFEVGEHDGLPFFSLEFCSGGTLADRLRSGPLAASEAAALVETLARAVRAAHQAHVLHRDLKPGNVLLAGGDRDAPLSQLTPKVSDFGLARKLDAAGPTLSGDVLGTPSYMAPEQAAGQTREQGTAVDVYSLGVILYECLTGRPPFRAATALETLQQVRHAEPVAVRQLVPGVPRDLETICHRCLQKDPRKRYTGADALADDLHRFQRGEPIRARPVGRLERAARWCRRYPVVAVLLVLLAAALGGALVEWRAATENEENEKKQRLATEAQKKIADQATEDALASAERERETAEKERRTAEKERRTRGELEQVLTQARVQLADQYWQTYNTDLAQETLDACPPALRNWEWRYLARLFGGNVRVFRRQKGVAHALALSPDSGRLAAAGDGSVKVWNTADGKVLFTLGSGRGPVLRSAALSPDGRRVAVTALPDEEKTSDLRRQVVGMVHDVGEVRPVRRLTAPFGDRVNRFLFSPDGKTLAGYLANFPTGVRLWDPATGEEVKTLGGFGAGSWFVTDAAFSPDSRLLATVGRGKENRDELRVVEVPGGKTTLSFTAEADQNLVTVAFSADGKRLAVGGRPLVALPGNKGILKVWDLTTGQEVKELPPPPGGVSVVALSPEGRLLVAVDAATGSGRVLDLEKKGEAVLALAGLQSGSGIGSQVVAFSPDGKRLAAAGGYNLRIWDIETRQEVLALRGHTAPVTAVVFGAGGRFLASAGREQAVRLWDLTAPPNPQVLRDGRTYFTSAVLSPDGELAAAAGHDPTPGKTIHGTVTVWKTATGERVRTLAGHTNMVNGLAFSPNGKQLLSAGWDRVTIWDIATGAEALSFRGHKGSNPTFQGANAAVFSPDGTRVASTGQDGTVQVWDPGTGKVQFRWEDASQGQRFGQCLAFNATGDRLAVGFRSDLKVFDLPGRRVLTTIPQGVNASHGATLALSPDGAVLASIGMIGGSAPSLSDIHGWDAATGKPLFDLRGHLGNVAALAFSRDGTRLASAGIEGAVKLWDVARRQEVLTLRAHAVYTASVAFSHDGHRLVTTHTPYANPGASPGEIRVWDARPLVGSKSESRKDEKRKDEKD